MYVAVEPSKVPPGVATAASLTTGGDPQSAEGRRCAFHYHAYSTTTTHMVIGNFLEVNYYPFHYTRSFRTYIYVHLRQCECLCRHSSMALKLLWGMYELLSSHLAQINKKQTLHIKCYEATTRGISLLILILAHVGGVPVHIPCTQVCVASPLARPNPLSHVYVAVEPSKLPLIVVTVASLTAGGDPQSADGRSHSQN